MPVNIDQIRAIFNRYTNEDHALYNILDLIIQALVPPLYEDFDSIREPNPSRAGKARIYYDPDRDKLRLSENNRSFVDMMPHECARVYNSAAISIPDNALTALTFDSERYDTDALHSILATTSRFTIRLPAVYSVGASVNFASNVVNDRLLTIRVNGNNRIVQTVIEANGTDVTGLSVHTEYFLNMLDYVECVVYQNSGGALNVTGGTESLSPEFWIRRLT